MTRNRTSLILFVAAVLGVLIVPSMVQARSRTGSDLGSRVAALEAAIVRDSGESLRVIRGRVNSAGAIESGSGFTLNHPSIGRWEISFSTPFADVPAVVALVNGGGDIIEGGVASFATTLFTRDPATLVAVDIPFSFIVVGRQ